MNPFEMVVAIIVVITIGKVLQARYGVVNFITDTHFKGLKGNVQGGITTYPVLFTAAGERVGGSGVSDCFAVGKWVSRPVLQRGNLCHGPHPPGAMIAHRDFRFQRLAARRSQPRSTVAG